MREYFTYFLFALWLWFMNFWIFFFWKVKFLFIVFIEEIYKHNAGIKHKDFLQSGLQILEGTRSIVYFVFGSADRRAGEFRLNGVSFAFSDRVTMTPHKGYGRISGVIKIACSCQQIVPPISDFSTCPVINGPLFWVHALSFLTWNVSTCRVGAPTSYSGFCNGYGDTTCPRSRVCFWQLMENRMFLRNWRMCPLYICTTASIIDPLPWRRLD